MQDQLLKLLHRTPFVPFTIIMTTGQQYEVAACRLLALGQTQITLYLPKSNKNHILRLCQISSIHISQAA